MPDKPEEKQEVRMPVTEKPAVMLDDKTQMAWIGLPISRMDELSVVLTLDHVKLQLVGWKKQMSLRSRIINPVREGIGGMMKRLGAS